MTDPLHTAALARAQSALKMLQNTTSKFSLARMLQEMLASTWPSTNSYERSTVDRLHRAHGEPQSGYRIPGDALRDLNTAVPADGGYLVSTSVGEYIGALQPASAVLRLGANVETADRGPVVVPKGAGSVTTHWLADELDSIGESQPIFEISNATPKILGAYCEISRQLLLQSNAEAVVRQELRNAAAAALDVAVISGTGALGQPLGILNVAGIGAFTGTALDQAALRNAQADVSTANAVVAEDRCGYVAGPDVAELLSTRQRFTGSDRTLWEGSSHAGTVEGCRAYSTNGVPASTMVYGDWSHVTVVQWDGGMTINADPFTKFNQAVVGIRLLLPVDIVITRPAGLSVATSIT